MIPNTKIFVGSLPARTSSEELRHLFQTYGHVTECDIMNRCGFVHMETADQAENAIKALNNSQFKGQSIVVEPGRMKDKVNKQGQDRGSGARGGMGSGNIRPQSNFNRSQQGNRNFSNNQQQQGGNQSGGPMRRDRNFQQNRNQGPYQNRSQDGGNRLGQQSRWQGNNQGNNFDDNIGGGGGNYGGGNERLNNSGNNLGNQDRRGFALPGGNQMFGGNNQGSSFNNNPGGNFGGYNRGNQGGGNQDFRGGNQSGNNQGFRGGYVSGNSYGNNNQGGYQNRRDSVPQTSQQDSQFQNRPPYQKPQQQMSNFGGSPGAQTQNQGQDFNRQNFGGNINNSFGGGMPRDNNSFGQRSNNQFAGGNNQRPQNNNFGSGMQRPQGNGPPRGGNFSGPPHKDNNFGGQKPLNSSYNQAFPPLGAPAGNRNGPRTNMQNNGNNRRY